MALSKAMIVKYARSIGTFDAEVVSDALDCLQDDEMATLYALTKKLNEQLINVKSETVAVNKQLKSKKPDSMKLSRQQKLKLTIQKIKSSLDRYEETDEVDVWDLSFEVEVKLESKTSDEIKEIHSKLIVAGCSADKLKLLNYVERGKLYNFLKREDRNNGSWFDICKALNVCRRTADRYIDFFFIMKAYPRLIVCELSFEMIIVMYKELNEYLNADEKLMAKPQLPLKEIRVYGHGAIVVTPEEEQASEANIIEGPQELLSTEFSWDPTWQLTDELFDID